ncbi:MAG: sulfatase-like hydrolase/transferase [Pirellulaceae bacterium]
MLSVLFVTRSTTGDEPNAPRPNVVFIMADDMGWGELGCYGQKRSAHPTSMRSPNKECVSRRIIRGAVCSQPLRVDDGAAYGHCLIRGNQQAKVAFPEFTEGQHPIHDETLTMAEAFQSAGYATGAMGKWGLGPVGSTGDPNRQGFDLFVGYNCQAIAHSYYAQFIWRNDEHVEINPQPIPGHQKQPSGDVTIEQYTGQTYAPKMMIDAAEEFIDSNHDKPFFLYLPFIEPHVAMHPPRDSVQQYPAEWDDTVYRGEAGYLPHPRPRAAYAAMISDVDRYVGRVMAKLEEHGIADNTIVVFTSDNGTTHEGRESHFHVGGCDAEVLQQHRGPSRLQGSVYEGGIRVPMIVRYPGHVAEGAINDTVSHFADWFPTLASATGLAAPAETDGENLWPVMTGGADLQERKPLVWVFPEYGGQVAVRIGDYKVLRRNLKRPKQESEWEVYNIAEDISESNDLSEEHPEIVAQAIQILRDQTTENEIFPVPIPGVNEAE